MKRWRRFGKSFRKNKARSHATWNNFRKTKRPQRETRSLCGLLENFDQRPAELTCAIRRLRHHRAAHHHLRLLPTDDRLAGRYRWGGSAQSSAERERCSCRSAWLDDTRWMEPGRRCGRTILGRSHTERLRRLRYRERNCVLFRSQIVPRRRVSLVAPSTAQPYSRQW